MNELEHLIARIKYNRDFINPNYESNNRFKAIMKDVEAIIELARASYKEDKEAELDPDPDFQAHLRWLAGERE